VADLLIAGMLLNSRKGKGKTTQRGREKKDGPPTAKKLKTFDEPDSVEDLLIGSRRSRLFTGANICRTQRVDHLGGREERPSSTSIHPFSPGLRISIRKSTRFWGGILGGKRPL